MFISKKRFLELREELKNKTERYEAELKRRWDTEKEADEIATKLHSKVSDLQAEISDLKTEIADLQAELAEKALPEESKKETARKISGKIGVFSTKEYSEPDGKHTVYFAGKVGVKREELEKASIAAVRAVIESLEPEHRKYAVLEYVFKNVMEQAMRFTEISL